MPSKAASLFERQAGVLAPAPVQKLCVAARGCGPDQLRDRVDDATEFAVHGVGDHLSLEGGTSQSSAHASGTIASWSRCALSTPRAPVSPRSDSSSPRKSAAKNAGTPNAPSS